MQRINLEFLSQYDELNLAGEPDVKTELIQRFFVSVPRRLEAIQAALGSGNSHQLRHEAHALKNIVGTIGAEIFAELCLNLEDCAHRGDWDRASSLADRLHTEFAAAGEELKSSRA